MQIKQKQCKMTPNPVVVLVGKLGHGKTYLLNKLCEARFPSAMGANSCTTAIQYAEMPNNITIVDTPGFYSSSDIAMHIAAQKVALEDTPLSGVYVVVKYGRASEIAEPINKIMNFIGSDDLRVIVTHCDTVDQQSGYNPSELKNTLSDLLGISTIFIKIVGKNTSPSKVQNFIRRTLHAPKKFSISSEQVASVASLCVGARKISKSIDEVFSKIQAASIACNDVVRTGKTYYTDQTITLTQHITCEEVKQTKERLFRKAAEEMSLEQQNLVYGKAGLVLSLRLKEFMKTTNKNLSWDVTNAADCRNVYKMCNFCDAVYNKTSGCDGETICGAVPTSTKRSPFSLVAEFKHHEQRGWVVQYFYNGVCYFSDVVSTVYARLNQKVVEGGGSINHTKRAGSILDSGCGARIAWSTMRPIPIEWLTKLGEVELCSSSENEEISRLQFDLEIKRHEKSNRVRMPSRERISILERFAIWERVLSGERTSVVKSNEEEFTLV